MRSLRRLLAVVCFAGTVLAAGRAGFAQETGAPVRLVAPQAGARLAAGSTAELEWAPLAGFDRLPEVEEWEAFLSLDGGVTYPVRITPHLDQALRRFSWHVPPFPTRDARILLRFGNEHQETPVELPARFSISAPSAVPPGLEPMLLLASRSSLRGEPALPGQAGVVAWVEGSRRGGSQRQVVADEPAALKAAFKLPGTHAESAELPSPLEPEWSVPGRAGGAAAAPPDRQGRACSRAGTGPIVAADILLLTQRQNE
ncbi:MAG: hypothetical protein ACLGI9_20570 [Thermoanaerobaculia bacterium]